MIRRNTSQLLVRISKRKPDLEHGHRTSQHHLIAIRHLHLSLRESEVLELSPKHRDLLNFGLQSQVTVNSLIWRTEAEVSRILRLIHLIGNPIITK